MLDQFLSVAYETEKRAEAREELVRDMMKLPKEELHKLVQGEKVAHLLDGDGCWVDQFKGTPLYDEALELEEERLKVDIAEQQMRLQEDQQRRPMWDQRDAINLRRRVLELRLRQSELAEEQVEHEEPAAPAPAPQESPVEEMASKAASALLEELRKEAAELTEAARDKIKPKNFALSAKQSDTGEPKYPIEDKRHAANALSRVQQFGSPKEKSEVFKDVAKKYPELASKSSVPAVAKKAEEHEKSASRMPKAVLERAKSNIRGTALRGALAGGAAGGLSGAAVGSLLDKDDRKGGAIKGGLGGAAAGALGGAAGGTMLGTLGNIGLENRMRMMEGFGSKKAVKKVAKGVEKSASFEVADQAGRLVAHMEKDAFGAELMGVGKAMLGGLKGMGSFAGTAAKGIGGALSKGGLEGGLAAAKSFGAQGLKGATQFAKANPAAALGLAGAAGLGGGYLANKAMS